MNYQPLFTCKLTITCGLSLLFKLTNIVCLLFVKGELSLNRSPLFLNSAFLGVSFNRVFSHNYKFRNIQFGLIKWLSLGHVL